MKNKISYTLLFLIINFVVLAENNSQFISQVVPSNVSPGESFNISVTFKNTGTTTWRSSDNYRLGTQSPQDNTIWLPTNRVQLPNDVSPGAEVTFNITLTAPVNEGIYALQWRMVQDGVEWFGQQSEVVYYVINTQTSDTLMIEGNHFSVSSHIVSTSFFCWYGEGEWQVNGPWIPINGRESWDGSVEYWERMIKQVMAANIDVFYVELIPIMEESRVSFFYALNLLRSEGWNVPKVCPFLDPEITYTLLDYHADCSTEEGKDELIGHYIRFYKQYYAANPDAYADDYIYTQDNHPVLDIWHIQLHIDNYDQLTRDDVTTRLKAAFGSEHPIFNNSVKMINNAYSPAFSFADERIYQFEMQEYKIDKEWNGINSSLLKPGYWDQNVRDPGYQLKRDGGSHFKTSWDEVNSDATIDRVYIESFNEYDEGSGIYAARTDTVYRISSNTNTDVWSSDNDPWEYIKTTAEGAAQFNDIDKLGAKIIWNNIPDNMTAGEIFNAKVVVLNEGNESWSAANNIKLGQHDTDPESFGTRRYLIDDSQDEISEYGGIFRGRVKTFNIDIVAPNTTGSFVTHWQMLKEGIAWFGDTITKTINVSAATGMKKNEIRPNFTIYPTPANINSEITINGEFNANDIIIIYDINGRKIFEKVFSSGQSSFNINLSKYKFQNGLYFVRLVSNNNIQTKKMLIKTNM